MEVERPQPDHPIDDKEGTWPGDDDVYGELDWEEFMQDCNLSLSVNNNGGDHQGELQRCDGDQFSAAREEQVKVKKEEEGFEAWDHDDRNEVVSESELEPSECVGCLV